MIPSGAAAGQTQFDAPPLYEELGHWYTDTSLPFSEFPGAPLGEVARPGRRDCREFRPVVDGLAGTDEALRQKHSNGDVRALAHIEDVPQLSPRGIHATDTHAQGTLHARAGDRKLSGQSPLRKAHDVNYRVQPTAQVDESAEIGDGSSVWELAQIREGARLGAGCVVGRGAYVGTGVRIGDNVKIQNYALVYEPAELGDGVFVGPAVVLTNDHNPRSVDPEGKQKRGGDWEAVGVTVAEGASLGARSVCVAPVRIGRWAMVAAGAVVTKDVPDFGLVVGVPARRIGWVGRVGVKLVERAGEAGVWECPQTGAVYEEKDGSLSERAA